MTDRALLMRVAEAVRAAALTSVSDEAGYRTHAAHDLTAIVDRIASEAVSLPVVRTCSQCASAEPHSEEGFIGGWVCNDDPQDVQRPIARGTAPPSWCPLRKEPTR